MNIFDTARKRKIIFTPRDPRDIRIYVCGPTVYDRIHLGNGRAAVVFDLLRRVLEEEHGEGSVRMVRNITDVDDKINARAAERGVSIGEVTDTTSRWFHEDAEALGTLRPAEEPRATSNIGPMIAMIERILANGHGYVTDSHVLFDVSSDPESGKLFRAGMTGEASKPGHGLRKRNPADFVLWKPSGPGQPAWDSPWGRGRPGWHIECSAMLRGAFGPEGVDIHGGGADLQFPHHENEAAQHRCAHPGEPFARHWMHNGMVTVNGKKMSKSEGNFTTVREVLDRGFGGDAVRLALLTAQYRNSLDWNDDLLAAAQNTVNRWRSLTDGVNPRADERFVALLRDDLSTPAALARMHELESTGNVAALAHGFSLLGLADAAPALTVGPDEKLRAHVEHAIAQREEARARKDWVEADRIRDALRAEGVVIEDKPGGAVWSWSAPEDMSAGPEVA